MNNDETATQIKKPTLNRNLYKKSDLSSNMGSYRQQVTLLVACPI